MIKVNNLIEKKARFVPIHRVVESRVNEKTRVKFVGYLDMEKAVRNFMFKHFNRDTKDIDKEVEEQKSNDVAEINSRMGAKIKLQ